LTIAGNDEENYRATLPPAENVRFAGPVSGAAKDALLRSAAALVLPSYSENFGNVVLEAMAAGTPVVVTPEVGLADEVRRAHAGLVAAPQPRELAAAINELLRDPVARRTMGECGRRAVAERFAWPRVAEEMEAQYANLLR